MKYYKLSQFSGNTSNIITIPPIAESELALAQGIVRQIDDLGDKEYLNFYEKPRPIISSKLKNAIEPYLPEIIGIPISVANPTLKLVIVYWLLDLELVESRGVDATAREKNGTFKSAKLKIKSEDVGERKLFKTTTGTREHVVADLDILEIILRNNIVDIQFEEILVI